MSRVCVSATWDDVPHITPEQKAEWLADMRPHERDARTRGLPSLGSGAIYSVPEERYVVDPTTLPHPWPPAWFPRAFGLDVGWNRTAAVWGAWDRSNDVIYVYSEHYLAEATPAEHVLAIHRRGRWIPGVIDPAANGRSQADGTKLIETYRREGVDVAAADNAVEAGIDAVQRRLASGRLKILSTCRALIGEMRIYRRDDKGKVVKENDHACDALRYLVMSGMRRGIVEPTWDDDQMRREGRGRSERTGY